MNNAQEAHEVVNILSENLLMEDYPEALVRALEETVEAYYNVKRDQQGCYN
ncbi:hypothetical protein OAL13_00045 [bacterium]|nr:hypothetical protein [bacterium]